MTYQIETVKAGFLHTVAGNEYAWNFTPLASSCLATPLFGGNKGFNLLYTVSDNNISPSSARSSPSFEAVLTGSPQWTVVPGNHRRSPECIPNPLTVRASSEGTLAL